VRKNLLSCFLVLLALALPVPAQVYDMEKVREPMILLDGLWRFHPGDDSHWADPAFDDSQWPLIRADKSWNEQGYAKLSGFAWYRAKLLIPEDQSNLSLTIPQVITSYQIFADGRLIGGFGGMPPHPYPITQFVPAAAYRLPSPPAAHARTLVIAIRVWDWPGWESKLGAGISEGVRIGASALIQNSVSTSCNTQSLNQASNVFLAILEILAGLAALAFFVLHPTETEYLWFSIVMSLAAGLHLGPAFYLRGHLDVRTWGLFLGLFQSGLGFAQLAFFLRLLRGKRSWLFWLAVAFVSASLPVPIGASLRAMGWRYFPAFSLVQWNAIMVVLGIPLTVWILSLLFRQALKGRFDARLLLAPVLLQQLASLTDSLLWFGRFMLGWRRESYARFYTLSNFPFPFSVANVCDLLFLVGMLAIFVLRFTRTSRQEDAHQREIEAARIIQQVLIPAAIPDVPGFSIQSVYKPASQVGGDFFQIIPTQTGGVLAVVGDVSGKGLPAAMTVSLLVGTVRTLAHYTQSPGEILAAMNQRMLARTSGGFTTCFVMRIDVDGALTVANAGHLAPYLRGTELAVEGGLPLGLAAESTYNEITFRLDNNDQLTLVTDGVVEARDPKGELLGFERLAALSAKGAVEIAEAAQRWGQEDDITVLAITPTAKVEAVPA
jgi:hypothetical protein